MGADKPKRLEGRKILVADDEKRLVDLMNSFLKAQGATVFVAGNGAEAFRIAAFENPDAILMDLNMPGCNGVESIRSMRTLRSQQPILVLSGYSGEENFAAAREAGADECLSKPAMLEDVIRMLEKLLAKGA